MKTPTAKLGEICEINPPTEYDFGPEDACSFVPMEAVDDLDACIARITTRPFREVAKGYTPFAENDVIVAKITPCMENGKCAIGRRLHRGVAFGSTEFHVLRATKRVLPEWLFYFWRFPPTRKLAAVNMTGSAGQKRIPASFLETADILLPGISEQRRISERLEQADRLRRTRRYALELTDTFLPAAFLELFGDPNPAVNTWPTVTLGEHLEAIEGGVNFNPVGENDPASDWRVLKVSAVSWSDFLAEESKPISPTESFSEKLIVQRGDLIMSRANTVELVGAVARVRTPPPKVLLPDKLWRLKLRARSQLLPDYLLYALRSRAVRREIEIRASGTSGSMKNISKEDVRELRLPVPALPLQQKFAALVERVERLRAVQREALRQAEHLFASLLHRAFSGEL